MTRSPHHVFMTTDTVGGVWTYSLDLAKGLTAQGVEVTLAVVGPAADVRQVAQARAVQGLHLVQSEAPLDWVESDPQALDRAGLRLAEQAADLGADIVHLNSPTFATASFAAPVVGACHSCVASWWAAVKEGPAPEDFQWRTERLGQGYRACTMLVAPSAAFARETARIYGVAPAVVWNGRSAQPRRPGGAKRSQVVTSGRLWDEGKNLASLDAAADFLSHPVLAAGPLNAPHGASITPQTVRVLGQQSAGALAQLLNQSSVFASLALYEPFGYGVLEAAQSGCALVLSDIPTFRELWSGAAVFVQPRASIYAAGVLDALLSDPEESARLGALAAERAQRYSVEAMAEGMLRLYGKAYAQATRGAAA